MSDQTVQPIAPDAARLSPAEVASLRRASSWARTVAIIGLAFAVVVGLGLGVFAATSESLRSSALTGVLISILAAVIFAAVAGQQLLGYRRGIASFLAHREPALPASFRNLRTFFWAYSIYMAFSAAMGVLTLLRVL
jgi:hypothetical protein